MSLVQVHDQFISDKDVVFFGLTDEGEADKDKIRHYLQTHEVTWPNGYGADSTIGGMGIRALPTIVVVGRDGKISWAGHHPQQGLAQAIKEALAKPAPAGS